MLVGKNRRGVKLVLAAAVAAALFAVAPGAQGRSTANLYLYVYFGYDRGVTVKLPDGTPVGVTSGSPTVIPAGFYSVVFVQPGCVQVPTFEMQGPGVSLAENLSGGEDTTQTDPAILQPNSTYTWRNDANASTVYTFATNSQVLGTQPANPNVPLPTSGPPNKSSGNSDVVGSALVPFRGTLVAGVSAAGKLTLHLGGKSVSALQAGRYTVTVTDRSRTSGFILGKPSHGTMTLTGAAFTGKRSRSVDLTAGGWKVMLRPGKPALAVHVT
jgi:hypothetical protein